MSPLSKVIEQESDYQIGYTYEGKPAFTWGDEVYLAYTGKDTIINGKRYIISLTGSHWIRIWIDQAGKYRQERIMKVGN